VFCCFVYVLIMLFCKDSNDAYQYIDVGQKCGESESKWISWLIFDRILLCFKYV